MPFACAARSRLRIEVLCPTEELGVHASISQSLAHSDDAFNTPVPHLLPHKDDVASVPVLYQESAHDAASTLDRLLSNIRSFLAEQRAHNSADATRSIRPRASPLASSQMSAAHVPASYSIPVPLHTANTGLPTSNMEEEDDGQAEGDEDEDEGDAEEGDGADDGEGFGDQPASRRVHGGGRTLAPVSTAGGPSVPAPTVAKGRPMPEHVRRVLLGWFLSHSAHPFPSPGEKKQLMASTGLTAVQIRNWLVNQRKRHWRPTMLGREPRCKFDAALAHMAGINGQPQAQAGAGGAGGGGGSAAGAGAGGPQPFTGGLQTEPNGTGRSKGQSSRPSRAAARASTGNGLA